MMRKRTRARGFVTDEEACGRLDIVALRIAERISGKVEADIGVEGFSDAVMETAEEVLDGIMDRVGEKRVRRFEELVQSEPVRGQLMRLLGVSNES